MTACRFTTRGRKRWRWSFNDVNVFYNAAVKRYGEKGIEDGGKI